MSDIPDGFIECPECGGHGMIEVDTPITDYVNGHDVWTEWWTCPTCMGQYIVEDPDYDEDAE